MPDHCHLVGTDIIAPIPGNKTFIVSPLEKSSPTGAQLLNDTGGNSNMSKKSSNSLDHLPNSVSTLSSQHLNGGLGRIRDGIGGSQWESSLFSSSFSDVFNRKLRLSTNDVLSQNMAKNVDNHCEEEEPFEALEEIEAKTIGNLLPAEDDLFSAVTNELGCNGRTSGGDDVEDVDLFSNVGGMEMEGDDRLVQNLKNSYLGGVSPAQGSSNFPMAKGFWCSELSSNHDVRAAEAVLSAFNNGDLAGKMINIESNFAMGGQSSMHHPKLEKGKHGLGEGLFSNLSSTQIAFSPSASYIENGTPPVLHSAIQVPIGAFTEPPRVSGVPITLPSSVSVAVAGNSYSLHEPSHSTDTLKSVNQCIPIFHPHSFPENHDGLANGFPYNSPNAIGGIGSSIGSKVMGGFNNPHIRVGHPMDINEGANRDGTLRGHHYMWNNSNADRQHPSSHVIWPNSPSFGNNVSLSHIPGFAQPIMVNAAPANHHVGSAPAINPSLWERRRPYSGEASEASSFRLGSLGNISSPPHPMEIATRNIFPHVAGSLVDMTKSAGLGSPQRMCHNFPGHSQNDRMRSFSHRRVDSNTNPTDKKQYELDIDRILRGEDGRTTLMIKNIPNKYTSKMLLAAIDEQCRGTYDFIYLPIDFKNKCNVGYAFINMVDAQRIIPFYKAFNGKKWEKFNSEKVANLAYARIQGKAALVAHFQNSSLMNEDKRCRPILFHTDGPNAGDPEPFPMGSHVRPRLSKSRSSGNEENHRRGSLSTVVNAEDYSGNGTDSSSGSD